MTVDPVHAAPLRFVLAMLLPVVAHGPVAQAQEHAPTPQKLRVATRHVPPFAIRESDGSWSGITIELWKRTADELGREYEFKEAGIEEMLLGLQDGNFDVAAAALTLTAEREKRVDFTHAFFNSGLGIAVRGKPAGWWAGLRAFLSMRFAKIVAILAVVLMLVGAVEWLCERRRNPEDFGGGVARGLGSGFWWSAVTMTTVGYGDKAPRTLLGRMVALVWMFAGLVLISTFTAAIASTLTVSQLETDVEGPEDLPKLYVGTVVDSTAEAYLRDQHIHARGFETSQAALHALAARGVDAVVYDAPLLRYLVSQELELPLRVLSREFEPSGYAIAVPQDSPLEESINRIILEATQQPEWRDVIFRYMGK